VIEESEFAALIGEGGGEKAIAGPETPDALVLSSGTLA